ncbi:MAG: hypothetical protein AAF423_13905 [Pseudomonadota bacterium]
MTPTQTVSFENDILGNGLGLQGLPYFNPEQDQVVHFTEPERLFISVTISDPATLSPSRVWLRVDVLTGNIAKASKSQAVPVLNSQHAALTPFLKRLV